MHRVAPATMRSFVRRIAEATVHPAASAESGLPDEGPELCGPPPEPTTP